PAPTRRFLPASTSLAAKSSGPASISRNAFQTSRSTQLLSSGPPSTSTPRFQRRPGTFTRDEIDTSFDDEDDTLTFLPSRSTAKEHDFAESIDDYLQEQSPLLHRTQLDPSTPATNKRKVFHPPDQKREPITISSSPEYEEQDEDEHPAPHQAPNLPVAQWSSEGSLVEAIKSPDQREVTTASKFKDTMPGPRPIASVAKSAFRSLSKMSSGPQINAGADLPDVFSPSKRNGKHDYLANGNAELVRQWVLNIAAQQSQVSQQQREIMVAEVRPDSSRRFVIVLTADGSEWLIPGRYQESRTFLQSGLDGIRPGTKLALKSEATRWMVPIRGSTSNQEITVAAHWEI
ncbi:uncharacterized protein A1O9_00913, partial [Exophiala aquamarina CBS 119918]